MKNKKTLKADNLAKAKRAFRLQYGALPYRISPSGAPEFLLVTTRESRRWIIPKGGPIKGLKPARSAAQEAFEEAGIRGTVGGRAIGAFTFNKNVPDTKSTIPCEVRVFPLLVKRQFKNYAEAAERTARWFEPEAAIAALKDAGLRDLVALYAHRLLTKPKPAKRL